MVLKDHRENKDLGQPFEITDLTKNSDRSWKSPRESRSWTDLHDHRHNQDLGRIFEITDPTISWTNFRDPSATRDLGRIFDVIDLIMFSEESWKSPKNQDHGPISVIIDTTKIFD